jgi:uncharacterized protein YcbX
MSAIRECRVVGHVVGLWRYPVKSMCAEALNGVDVSWHGLAGDRRWAFVRSSVATCGFPWLTLRERHDMNAYRPAFSDPDRPDRSAVYVTTPSGIVHDMNDPALAAELCPSGAVAIKQDRGTFDTFPLSLITTQTIYSLSQRVDMTLDVHRFRPNLLVDATDGSAFPEDNWVGCELRMGGIRMRIDKRDGRCIVITIDPVTSERSNRILRTVVKERGGCLGVYGACVTPGRIELGDAVLIEYDRQ